MKRLPPLRATNGNVPPRPVTEVEAPRLLKYEGDHKGKLAEFA
ncbi:MAG: hypothetical protein ACRDTC_26555 [Pseudonocardiaceae bacterium]